MWLGAIRSVAHDGATLCAAVSSRSACYNRSSTSCPSMQRPRIQRFAQNQQELDALCLRTKLRACPHCGRVGALILHGFLRGNAERTACRIVRGRRFFCSNRHRRQGCGRTHSVLLAELLERCTVTTATLSDFVAGVSRGQSRHATWKRLTTGTFSLQTGYRIWRRLTLALPHLRSRLVAETPPPESSNKEPLSQLIEHCRLVCQSSDAPFARFQNRFQVPLLT